MLLHSEFAGAAAARRDRGSRSSCCPTTAWPVWTGGNHDNHRFASRWAATTRTKARAALFMLLGLRGTPFLYYGDEIGMPDTDVPDDRMLDPVGVFHGARVGRDPERTPMPWTGEPGARVHRARRRAVASRSATSPPRNVADQRHDPTSMLALARDLISLRDAMPDLARATTAPIRVRTTSNGSSGAVSGRSSC